MSIIGARLAEGIKTRSNRFKIDTEPKRLADGCKELNENR